MGWLLKLYLLDEASIIKIFRIFKIGLIHPENAPGVFKGLILGIWRIEIQIIFGFWNKGKEIGEIGHA